MIDFLWHLGGSVPLEAGDQSEVVLNRLEDLLKRQHKPIAERTADGVTFDAPLWCNFFAPNWLAMAIYDQGRFWVDKEAGKSDLRYDLRSLHGPIFCLFAVGMLFAIVLPNGGLLPSLYLGVAAFGWVYGMNILLALARVPRLIREILREA